MAVGRLLAHIGCRNLAASAGSVVNDDRLAKLLPHLACQCTRHGIGDASGREGNDHGHGTVGEILRDGGCTHAGSERGSTGCEQLTSIPHDLSPE